MFRKKNSTNRFIPGQIIVGGNLIKNKKNWREELLQLFSQFGEIQYIYIDSLNWDEDFIIKYYQSESAQEALELNNKIYNRRVVHIWLRELQHANAKEEWYREHDINYQGVTLSHGEIIPFYIHNFMQWFASKSEGSIITFPIPNTDRKLLIQHGIDDDKKNIVKFTIEESNIIKYYGEYDLWGRGDINTFMYDLINLRLNNENIFDIMAPFFKPMNITVYKKQLYIIDTLNKQRDDFANSILCINDIFGRNDYKINDDIRVPRFREFPKSGTRGELTSTVDFPKIDISQVQHEIWFRKMKDLFRNNTSFSFIVINVIDFKLDHSSNGYTYLHIQIEYIRTADYFATIGYYWTAVDNICQKKQFNEGDLVGIAQNLGVDIKDGCEKIYDVLYHIEYTHFD